MTLSQPSRIQLLHSRGAVSQSSCFLQELMVSLQVFRHFNLPLKRIFSVEHLATFIVAFYWFSCTIFSLYMLHRTLAGAFCKDCKLHKVMYPMLVIAKGSI